MANYAPTESPGVLCWASISCYSNLSGCGDAYATGLKGARLSCYGYCCTAYLNRLINDNIYNTIYIYNMASTFLLI